MRIVVTTMTTPTVDEIVEGFGCCYPSSKCDIYFEKGIDHNIGLAKEITTYGNARYEEGVKAERERVMEWVKSKIKNIPQEEWMMFPPMMKGQCAGHNSALDNLTDFLSDSK